MFIRRFCSLDKPQNVSQIMMLIYMKFILLKKTSGMASVSIHKVTQSCFSESKMSTGL